MIKIPKTKAVVAALVAIITFIVFIPALQNEFLGDDFGYVVKNTSIRSLDLNLFKSAFLSFQHANWHPLTWISHAMDYAIWGLNPLGHHLTNNILHAVNTFIVVLLVVRLVEAARCGDKPPLPLLDQGGELLYESSPPILGGVAKGRGGKGFHAREILIAAGVTGLLFGLHPLRVEAVAWVAERKELLCGLFYLLSVLQYMSYRTYKTYAAYFLSLGLFILALLSKPMAITLPFVLLILDWYPFKRIHSLRTFLSVLGEKVPFISLSIVASILTIMAQEEGGTIISTEAIPLSTRGLVAAKCLFAYLWKMILPVNLMPAGYPYPNPIDVTMFSPEYLLWIVLLTGITITSVVIAKKQQLWLSVWLYYFVTLVPVLGIVKAGGMFMADRYSYLPSLGPSLVVGLLTAGIQEKILLMKRRRLLFGIGGVTVVLAIFIALSLITIKQIRPWKNDAAFMDNLDRIRLEEAKDLNPEAEHRGIP